MKALLLTVVTLFAANSQALSKPDLDGEWRITKGTCLITGQQLPAPKAGDEALSLLFNSETDKAEMNAFDEGGCAVTFEMDYRIASGNVIFSSPKIKMFRCPNGKKPQPAVDRVFSIPYTEQPLTLYFAMPQDKNFKGCDSAIQATFTRAEKK